MHPQRPASPAVHHRRTPAPAAGETHPVPEGDTRPAPTVDALLTPELAGKTGRVQRTLQPHARVAVAFSGGVDSSVLLALAVHALGSDRVLAVLGVSPSLAATEREAAHTLAAQIGARVVEVVTNEGERPAYRANGPDRCYHCKDELFRVIQTHLIDAEGITAVAYGENADDARRPDRPGALAATEHAVLRPLADAGLTKSDVRAVARALGLSCADKPAAPCLASRIPHHEPVTPQRLAQIEQAERAVRSLGFDDCRVRHHGPVARVELPDRDLPRAVGSPMRERLLEAVRAAGFRFVAIDLAGLQSGAFTLSLLPMREGP